MRSSGFQRYVSEPLFLEKISFRLVYRRAETRVQAAAPTKRVGSGKLESNNIFRRLWCS